MTQHNLTQILKVIRDLVMRNRPCYRDYLGNGQYKTKLLPEYLLPDFLRKNVVASKAEVQSAAAKATTAADAAQSTADAAQSTANAAQSTANTAKSTADAAQATASAAQTTANSAIKPSRNPDIGTNGCAYSAGNPYNADSPVVFYIGGTSFLRILVDKTSSVVKINPPVNHNKQADFEFSRLTSAYAHPKIKGIGGIVMHSSTSGSDKQFLITVDDTGTLKATEVT